MNKKERTPKYRIALQNAIKSRFKSICSNQKNVPVKLACSFIASGILFSFFAIMVENNPNQFMYNVFCYIATIFFSAWIIILSTNKGFINGLFRFAIFLIFFTILLCSIDFCVNIEQNNQLSNAKLIFFSTLSAIGILLFWFYFFSMFYNILLGCKKLLNYIKEKLFSSSQSPTLKLISFIENVTALLTAIIGLALSIKAIVKPIIDILRKLEELGI